MAPPSLAALVNVVGYLLGTALYGLLLGTVLRTRTAVAAADGAPAPPPSRLLVLTGLLGLTWNVGALWIQGVDPSLAGMPVRLVFAAAVSALGFLPAVVVHSVLAPLPARGEPSRPGALWAITAYALSAIAAGLQLSAAFTPAPLPAPAGLWLLTAGFVLLLAALTIRAPAVTREGRPLWILALAVFAVSALHLGQHTGRESWPTELVGHHASLPLAVAILLRDYRFALADIFLKRALTLTLVVVAVAIAHATIGLRWLGPSADVAVTTYVLGLVLAAVLLQEPARAFATWVVDTIVLRRPDRSALLREFEAELAAIDEVPAIPALAAARLGAALDAAWIEAREAIGAPAPAAAGARVLAGGDAARFVAATPTRRLDDAGDSTVPAPLAAVVLVPTVDLPRYVWCVGPLTRGRRLLSDDLALAESVAFLTARRLDALRVADERFAAALRERQVNQLATEAELRALRAQLNPHFLFNALTTVGYLIQVAPARAQSTLMRLTSLLRGVLRRSSAPFSRLGDEIALVHAYLEIEEARFEERLRVRVDVDAALDDVLIPSLLLQPLVENAVKHGIAPLAAGGTVEVSATLRDVLVDGQATLTLTVRDSGVGHAAQPPFDPPGEGLGLANVAQRLRAHFGDAASLDVDGAPGAGTTVRLTLPVRLPRPLAATAGEPRP